MNKLLLLTLSALVLAACGSGQPRPSSVPVAPGGAGMGQVFRDNVAQFEADMTADLARLEKPGLAGQAVAPFVYLNVLKLPSSNDTVRAYFKTNHVSPVTCSVDFGDGSSAVNQVVPTVGRIQTSDHTYSSSGTYTVVARCVNGGTVVGTQTVSVTIGSSNVFTVLGFEDSAAPVNNYNRLESYTEKGYRFTALGGCDTVSVVHPNAPVALGYGGTPLATQAIFGTCNTDVMTMQRGDGSAFSLKEFDFSAWDNASTTFVLTGYLQGGGTVTDVFVANTAGTRNPMQKKTLGAAWTNLTKVEFGNQSSPQNWHLIDNIKVVP